MQSLSIRCRSGTDPQGVRGTTGESPGYIPRPEEAPDRAPKLQA